MVELISDNPQPVETQPRENLVSHIRPGYMVEFLCGGKAMIKNIEHCPNSEGDVYLITFTTDTMSYFWASGTYAKRPGHPLDIIRIWPPKPTVI